MSGAERLYTPELLALAVELARYPARDELPLFGEARSATCGSTMALGLALDGDGRVADLGMRVRACAVGQAAAAIFARHAAGKDAAYIESTLAAIERWLRDGASAPDWPDLELIAAAAGYPARHGAMMLPWRAAQAALSSAPAAL